MAFDDGKKTVSGSVAHTDDAAAKVPFVSLKCGIAPTLTGKSAVECTQTGKNLFNVADYSQIYADRDGVDSYNYRYMIIQLKPNTTYTVSQNSGEYSGTPIILINNALPVGGANYFDLRKASDTKTYTTDSTGQLYIGSVNSYDDVAYSRLQECNVQIEVGSTATAYEPYVTPDTYTVNLGRTIYGGTADVVKGEGKEDYKNYTLDNLTWSLGSISNISVWYVDLSADGLKLPTNSAIFSGICDNYTPIRFNAVKDNTNTIALRDNGRLYVNNGSDTTQPTGKVTIELATPETFTFTPITPTPETVGKVNNVYCDTGDTEVTYYDNAHGFSEVTVNKTGKNFYPINVGADIFTNNGGASHNNDNGVLVINATTNNNCGVYILTSNTSCEIRNTLKFFYDKNLPKTISFDVVSTSENTKVAVTSGVRTVYTVGTTPTRISHNSTGLNCSIYVQGADLGVSSTLRISNFQIEYGSVGTSYEPYEAVSKTAYLHKVIYGGQADVVKGTAEPKNILLPSNTDSASTVVNGVARSYSLDSQTWTLEGTNEKTDANWLIYNGANFVVSKTLVVGDTYTYSHTLSDNCYSQFTYKDTNGTTRAIGYLVGNTNKNASVTFTIPSNFVELLRFQIGVVKTATSVSEEAVFQLEKASSKTEYAPYFEPFSFPPISMETDEGENTLFANEGDSVITYRKDTE